MTNLHAMLIVIIVWLTIVLHSLGVLPRAVDHAITYVYDYEIPCDCSTDMDCQEQCGGEY